MLGPRPVEEHSGTARPVAVSLDNTYAGGNAIPEKEHTMSSEGSDKPTGSSGAL